MTITGKQIAMARILLDLSQQDLAGTLGIARKTIIRIENSQSTGTARTVEKLRSFFEHKGIVFLPENGIKKQDNFVITLNGLDGFRFFRKDLLENTKDGDRVKVGNVNESLFRNVGVPKEEDRQYMDEMGSRKNLDFKILTQEGDTFFPAYYGTYRWLPKEQFTTTPFYLYGQKLAIILFEEEPKIVLIEHPVVARAYETQFNFMWERAIIPPQMQQKEKPS